MKKIFVLVSIVASYMGISLSLAEEPTGYRNLSKISVNGAQGIYYFLNSEGSWGVAGCPNAIYAYATKTVLNGVGEELLSIALSAKLSGKKVSFYGTCDSPGGEYFSVFSIWIE